MRVFGVAQQLLVDAVDGDGIAGPDHGGRRDRRRVRRGVAAKLGLHRRQDHVGIARLGQDRAHAAGLGQFARLRLAVGGGVEDDRGGRDRRLRPKLPRELEAVHGRHQDVGDDQLRPFGAHDLERGGAIGGLHQCVPGMAEQRQQELTIEGPIIDNENFCHRLWALHRGPLAADPDPDILALRLSRARKSPCNS